jgi:hypothetical protein
VEDRTRVSETKKLQEVLLKVRDETIARVDDMAERSFAQVSPMVHLEYRAWRVETTPL